MGPLHLLYYKVYPGGEHANIKAQVRIIFVYKKKHSDEAPGKNHPEGMALRRVSQETSSDDVAG